MSGKLASLKSSRFSFPRNGFVTAMSCTRIFFSAFLTTLGQVAVISCVTSEDCKHSEIFFTTVHCMYSRSGNCQVTKVLGQ